MFVREARYRRPRTRDILLAACGPDQSPKAVWNLTALCNLNDDTGQHLPRVVRKMFSKGVSLRNWHLSSLTHISRIYFNKCFSKTSAHMYLLNSKINIWETWAGRIWPFPLWHDNCRTPVQGRCQLSPSLPRICQAPKDVHFRWPWGVYWFIYVNIKAC